MRAFSWGALALPAVQNSLPAVQHDLLPAVQRMQDFHFKALAQDFHATMSVPDAPENTLPAVQADGLEF